jgi:predicted DNA binding protein
MTVIVDYRLPAADFVLGRASASGASVELERLLDDDGATVAYFWTNTDSPGEFEQSLSRVPDVTAVRVVDSLTSRQFYRSTCNLPEETLVGALSRFDAAVLAAEGDDQDWSFRVSFEDGTALSDFQTYCVESAGVALELDHLYTAVESASQFGSDLTPRQRETLLAAHEGGYFDVPRQVTLVDLASELDVSDQAVSERLRRGQSKLIRTHLSPPYGTDDEE